MVSVHPVKRQVSMVLVFAILLSMFLGAGSLFAAKVQAATGRQMEALGRGLVAVKTGDGVFLSWRLLGTESYDTSFNVYRNGSLIASNISGSTNQLDTAGSSSASYYVRSVVSGSEVTQSDAVTPWAQNYMDVPLQKPANTTLNSATVTYAANDATVADVDGDGQEIALVNGDFENWTTGWTLTEADYCSMDATAKNNKTYRLDLWQSADSDVYVSVAQSVNVGAGSYYFTYDIIGNSGLTGVISGSQTHTHSYTSKVTTAATCGSSGIKTYTCSCSASYTEAIPALSHNYVSYIKAPICTATGLRTYTCGNCGNSYTETIPATGHSYSNGSCTVCGAADPNYQAPDENIKNGLSKGDDGNYYYYINNEVQWNYTGLIASSAGRWYIKNGQAQLSYDGLITFEGTKYLIKAGHVNTAFTGITKQEGVYYYFNQGVNDLEFEGLVYCNGMKAYVQDGEVNFNKTGVVEDEGNLVYVKYGIWRNTFKGLARTDDGKWIYMANGTFDATYTGVAKLNANWVYVNAGYVDSSYSGTVTVNGVNYTVKYGVVQF